MSTSAPIALFAIPPTDPVGFADRHAQLTGLNAPRGLHAFGNPNLSLGIEDKPLALPSDDIPFTLGD